MLSVFLPWRMSPRATWTKPFVSSTNPFPRFSNHAARNADDVVIASEFTSAYRGCRAPRGRVHHVAFGAEERPKDLLVHDVFLPIRRFAPRGEAGTCRRQT